MRTIIVYGHQPTASAVFQHVDRMLREREDRRVGLAQTIHVDPPTAQALHEAGGELWYCGPMMQPAGIAADRYLLADSLAVVLVKAEASLQEFLNKVRVAA